MIWQQFKDVSGKSFFILAPAGFALDIALTYLTCSILIRFGAPAMIPRLGFSRLKVLTLHLHTMAELHIGQIAICVLWLIAVRQMKTELHGPLRYVDARAPVGVGKAFRHLRFGLSSCCRQLARRTRCGQILCD